MPINSNYINNQKWLGGHFEKWPRFLHPAVFKRILSGWMYNWLLIPKIILTKNPPRGRGYWWPKVYVVLLCKYVVCSRANWLIAINISIYLIREGAAYWCPRDWRWFAPALKTAHSKVLIETFRWNVIPTCIPSLYGHSVFLIGIKVVFCSDNLFCWVL